MMDSDSSGAISNSSSTGATGKGNQQSIEPNQENREVGVHATMKSNCSSEVNDVKATPESDVRHLEATEDTFIRAVQPQREGNTEVLYTAARNSGLQECEAQSGINSTPTGQFQGHINQTPTQSGTSKEGAVETLATYQQPEQQTSNPGQSIPHSQSQESNEQGMYSGHAHTLSQLDSSYSNDLLYRQTESAGKTVYTQAGRRQLHVHGQVSDTGDDSEPLTSQSELYSSEQEHRCENINNQSFCDSSSSSVDKHGDLSEHQLVNSTHLLSHTKNQCENPLLERSHQQHPLLESDQQQPSGRLIQQDPSRRSLRSQVDQSLHISNQQKATQEKYKPDQSEEACIPDSSQHALYQHNPSEPAAVQEESSHHIANQQAPAQHDAVYQEDYPTHQGTSSSHTEYQSLLEHAAFQTPSEHTAQQDAAYQQDPSHEATYQQDPSQQAAYQQDPSHQAAYQQDPSQQAAYQQDPSHQAAYQQDPSQQAAYQQDPSHQAATQQDPSQQAAYQQDPSHQAAYQQDPSQQAGYQQSPSQQAGYQQDPSQQAAYQQDPSQQAGYQQDPSQQAGYQQHSSQHPSYLEDPSQLTANQDPSHPATYQQYPSQQVAYKQSPSQQSVYQQDTSTYQQDPSQQAAYQQDPSQQAPSQQAAYQQDPSQQTAYQDELYKHGTSQNVTYQQNLSQQSYQHQVSQHEAYQQDPSQYAPYQQQQEAHQQGSSRHDLYSQDASQQGAYQQEYPQPQPTLYQQDPAEQGTSQQDASSQHGPSRQLAPQSVYQQHHSIQRDLPHHGAHEQVGTPQPRAHQHKLSQHSYYEQDQSYQHTQTQLHFRETPSHGGYQQDSTQQSFQQPGYQVPQPQQQTHAAISSEYSNHHFHQRDSQHDDQYSDTGYHFQYYKTNDPQPPVWRNDVYDSQSRSIYPQDSSYMSDSNSPLDPNRKTQPYGSPHEPHKSGRQWGWKRRDGRWSQQEKLRERESNQSVGPRTGYNTPPSHSWPSPASTSSTCSSSIGKHSPGYSSPSQMQSRGSPLHSDHGSPSSHLPESQQTEDCHSPKKTSGSSESKEEPGKTAPVFSSQIRDPRQGHSQAGNKHYTKSPKYAGFHETTNRRTAMLKRSNWKHSVAHKTRGPQLVEPHFKTTEKKSDPVHPEAGSAATKKSLSNFKIPKHKAASSEVNAKEVSGTFPSGKKSKREGEKSKPAIPFDDKTVDKITSTQAPKKSSGENVAVSETVEQAVQKHIPKSTKASRIGDRKAALSTSLQKKKSVRDKPELQQSTTLHQDEKAHVSSEKTVPVTGNSPRDIAAILSSLDTSSLLALSISIQQTLTSKATQTTSHHGAACSSGSDLSGATQQAPVTVHPVTLEPPAAALSITVASTAEGDTTQCDAESNAQSESILQRPQRHSHTNAQKSSGVVIATVLHSETTSKVPTTSKNDCVTSSERPSGQVSSKEPDISDLDNVAAQQSTALCNDTLSSQCKLQLTSVDCSVPHPSIHESTVGESIAKQSNGSAAINPATPPVSKDSGQSDSIQSSAGEYTKPTRSELDLSDFYDPRYTYKEYNLRRRPQLADMSVHQPAMKKRKVTTSNTQGTEQSSPTQVAAEVEQVSETRGPKLNNSQSVGICDGPENSKPEVLRESQDTNDELNPSKVSVQALPSFQKGRSHHKSASQILEDDKQNDSLEQKSTSPSVNALSESQAHLSIYDFQTASETRQDKARPKIVSKKRLQAKKCRNQQSKDAEHNSGETVEGMLCALCNQKADCFNLGFVFGPYRYNQGRTTYDEQSKASECPDSEKHSTTHHAETQTTCESTSTNTELLESSTVELWVHEECAVWAPGVCLAGNQLQGLLEAVSDGANRVCSSCGTPGATLGCGSRGCKNVYHYPCSRQTGSTFLEDQFLVFCPKHKEIK